MKNNAFLYREIPGSKSSSQENFPVGSFLIARQYRPCVKIYYDFARYGDDIADSATLQPQQKIDYLNRMRNVLEGEERVRHVGDPAHRAYDLRIELLRNRVPLSTASDLLIAFKRDAICSRYRNWGELLDYCRNSADPVGRFLLSLHGENPEIFPYSDALCTSLQILNHLQDAKKDLNELDRCYLPLDWLEEEGLSVEDLRANKSSPAMRRVYDRILMHVDDLNHHAAALVGRIKDRRMRLETAVVVNLAKRLTTLLKEGDALAGRVKLSKADFACAFAKASLRFFA